MNRTVFAAFGAAALSLSLIAGGPGFGQATEELRQEVSSQLQLANIEVEGGVESLTDDQVMQIKMALGDTDCCDQEKRDAVMRIIESE
jgi:hypothetical protein